MDVDPKAFLFCADMPSIIIPPVLYRGDADPSGVRQLRTAFPGSASGGLLTNFSNGGDGLAFVKESLRNLVARHVSPGWSATHFLSFSEHRTRALEFAAGLPCRPLNSAVVTNWDALLIELDTTRFTHREKVGHGLYHCTFARRMDGPLPSRSIPEWFMRHVDKLNRPPVHQVLLVDAITYFSTCLDSGVQGLEQALTNSRRDAEWLVLPMNAAPEIPGERTSMLDDGCIANVELFRFAAS